jgi:hypothetical protein
MTVKDVHVIPDVHDAVPVATDWTAPLPTPYSSCPDVNDVCPVPPLDTARVPLMFESVVVATHVGTPDDIARTKPFVEFAVTDSAPVPPEVVTRPFVVKLERVEMFCDVFTVTAFVAPVYVRPVEKVVVAELNLEKSDAVRQPLTEALALVQSNAPDEPPRN